MFVIFLVPNPVLNIEASPVSTTRVKVEWSYPLGAQLYYKYCIRVYSLTETLFNTTVDNNSTDVPGLEPGTRYNISVRTIAAPGSESTEEQTSSYTSKTSHLNAAKLQKR